MHCERCGDIEVQGAPDELLDGLRCPVCAAQLVKTTALDLPTWRETPGYCLVCRDLVTKGGLRFVDRKQVKLIEKLDKLDAKVRKIELFTTGTVMMPGAQRAGQADFNRLAGC